jgi:hypothetical protein
MGSMSPSRRVGVPPVSRGGQVVAERLDRHFATLVDAPAARGEDGTEALDLMTSLLPRTGAARRDAGHALWLRAPFRRLRRLIGL